MQIALASPELKERWAAIGASAPKMTRPELAAYINHEISRWGEAIKKSGAKLD
ncbi:hypothetical protein [Polynucleobacter necessarius]|uniref:hypothetical protein n=1 Tax=Polynucleobacter necessarius TaxID=576610 RepID=UPI001E54C273|nr:hypothetical protein [Polynucleobacter necessarius]